MNETREQQKYSKLHKMSGFRSHQASTGSNSIPTKFGVKLVMKEQEVGFGVSASRTNVNANISGISADLGPGKYNVSNVENWQRRKESLPLSGFSGLNSKSKKGILNQYFANTGPGPGAYSLPTAFAQSKSAALKGKTMAAKFRQSQQSINLPAGTPMLHRHVELNWSRFL